MRFLQPEKFFTGSIQRFDCS